MGLESPVLGWVDGQDESQRRGADVMAALYTVSTLGAANNQGMLG